MQLAAPGSQLSRILKPSPVENGELLFRILVAVSTGKVLILGDFIAPEIDRVCEAAPEVTFGINCSPCMK